MAPAIRRSGVGWVERKRNPSHRPARYGMANYRRNFLPGGSYFFTVNLADLRRALLTDHIDILRTAFRQVHARHPFAVEAAVVLPDHLHAIWTLPEDDADFAMRWRLIKSAFSRDLPRAERISPAAPKASAEFGSGDIGSTRCATRTTSCVTSITFMSIP
jgi:REP element-mobilizing transposase RayT